MPIFNFYFSIFNENFKFKISNLGMNFILFNLVIILVVIILFVVLSWVWPPNSPWAPWWRTNRKTARAICKLAGISKKDIVYDLGSGDGTFLITAAKEFDVKGMGIEIEPTRYFISKIRIILNNLSPKVMIKRKNFFDENLSEATVVVVYLVPKTLDLLLPKFEKELRKGTRIVSYKYQLNLKSQISNLKNNLFLYRI